MQRHVGMIAGLLCIGSALPLAAAEPAAGPEQITFKLKFEPGRTVRQKLTSKTVGDLKIFGAMKFQQTFEQTLVSRCRKVNPDGSAVIDVTLSNVAMHQSMGPITIDFDSRTWKPGTSGNPGIDLIGRIFSAMAGTTFTVTISPTGEPLKIEGLNAALKKAVSQLGDGQEAEALRKMFDDMISAIGDDNMMQQFRSFGRLAPPRTGPVNVGEKWDHTWSMSKLPFVRGALEGKGEYELLGTAKVAGHPCAKIRVKETFKMVPPDPQAPKPADDDSPMGRFLDNVNMEMSSSGGDGVAYLDCETGDVVRLVQTQNIELKISAPGDPKADDQELRDGIPAMSMKFRVSVSLDLLEGDAPVADGSSEVEPADGPATRPAADRDPKK